MHCNTGLQIKSMILSVERYSLKLLSNFGKLNAKCFFLWGQKQLYQSYYKRRYFKLFCWRPYGCLLFLTSTSLLTLVGTLAIIPHVCFYIGKYKLNNWISRMTRLHTQIVLAGDERWNWNIFLRLFINLPFSLLESFLLKQVFNEIV